MSDSSLPSGAAFAGAAFAIRSSRVVTPDAVIPAAIIISDGRIESVVASDAVPASMACEDFGDLVIAPGVVDAHVHINEPGRTHWEGFATATAAAAAGGVTTLIDMPLNSSPVVVDAASLQHKRDAANGKCIVNVDFYGGLIPGNEIEIPALIDSGVKGIKAFLCDSGLDEFPAAGEKELRSALPMLKKANLPLLAHAEIVSDTSAKPAPTFDTWPQRSYAAFADSRPASFELAAIELLIKLCDEFQTPIHIVHLATAKALPMISAAKAKGLPLTVETCPHYIYFCDDDIEEGQTQYKCCPPIRDAANRDALRQAVASGLIDTIGSDHSPCPPELKEMLSGDFSKAWGGISSLQLTLPIMATIAKSENWSLELLAKKLSQQPGETFGYSGTKGKIAAGYDADLVVWDPDVSWQVAGEQLHHRHSITPYDGETLYGQVIKTFVGGDVVFEFQTLPLSPGDLVDSQTKSLVESTIADLLNSLPQEKFLDTAQTCCASTRWCEELQESRPFFGNQDVLNKADEIWNRLDETDWLEAFEGHPQIGNVETLREKYANTKQIAGNEQAGVDAADEDVLQRLAESNREYLEKFGFIFIVFATGKSAAQMLELLEARLPRTREQELIAAAEEQSKITALRLKKLSAGR